MSNTQTNYSPPRVSIPIQLEELAESIWRLPRRERETLEDLLEKNFVQRALKRAKNIPRLRKEKKLLSLGELRSDYLNRR